MKLSRSKLLRLSSFTIIIATSWQLANAQSAASKINNASGQAQGAAELIGDIKQLFGKKKKVTADSAATTDAKPHAYYFNGKVSASARVINCDEMYPFNRGGAVIKKGLAYAMIDSAGNFIVPFGKFTGIEYDDKLKGTGFFRAVGRDAANNLRNFFINSKGKIIADVDGYKQFSQDFSLDGKYIVFKPAVNLNTPKDGIIAIDYDGKSSILTMPKGGYYDMQKGLCDSMFIYRVQVNGHFLYGFKDLNNHDVVPPVFDELNPFTDGVAVFGKRDDLGVISYGVIDKAGKVLVTPIFRRAPEPFHYGYALVNDAERSGLINKQGQFIYKFSNASPPVRRFTGKFAFAPSAVLTDRGEVIPVFDFLKMIGIRPASPSGGRFHIADNGGNGEVGFYLYVPGVNTEVSGVYNVFTGNSLYSAYARFYDTYRDPVSKLAYLRIESGKKDRFGAPVIIDGYINTQGEFVLIKGAGN